MGSLRASLPVPPPGEGKWLCGAGTAGLEGKSPPNPGPPPGHRPSPGLLACADAGRTHVLLRPCLGPEFCQRCWPLFCTDLRGFASLCVRQGG